MAIVANNNSFIFIHIYKCAGQTTRHVLQPYGCSEILKTHSSADEVMKYYSSMCKEEVFDNAFKFSFVRNPFDWMVSVFHHIRMRPSHPLFKDVDGKNFSRFLDHFLNERLNKDGSPTGRYQSLCGFLMNNEGKLLVNFIGRYEHLNRDLALISQKIGINLSTIPHVNRGAYDNHYRDYYRDNDVAIMKKYFERDLDYFKYCY